MYTAFFGLAQEPFSIAPDPRYLYMSERHREALAHLLYGVKGGGGFVLLTGEIGAGKTTVCRAFLEQVPKRCNVAYVFNPRLSAGELLQTVLEEFRIPMPEQPGLKGQVDALNAFLLRTHAVGQNNVLIIDEAQSLAPEVLEQLRLLTNLETAERKLLQIILIGQPELRTLLARPELEQLAQRVIARYHLEPLSLKEAARYVRHRLTVAGLTGPLPFDKPALQRLHALTGGVPRRLNLLADRALLGAYATGQAVVDAAVVDKAAAEVFDRPPAAPRRRRADRWRPAVAWAALAGVVGLGVGTVLGLGGAAGWRRAEPVAPAAAVAPRAASTPAAASPSAASATAGFNGFAAEDEAWRALLAGWLPQAPEGSPDCAALAGQALQCFRRADADLALLRRLSRPALVTLQPGDGPPLRALLVGLPPGQVLLQGRDGRQAWPLARFEAQWRGDLLTLWKSPPGYAEGALSTAWSRWVADHLPPPAGGTSAPADAGEGLKARVRDFQAAQGLTVDGVAGPVTLMQLNRVAGVAEPRLD
ncbi:ExeA family protein [Aquabacterium sp. J223]|uniref:ExeA family protein n=1 Tax=Aquabacterium sp. J223 TaxID=2898431 RepID=UPI0021AE3113|nr:ExeA family protein [Aquabacterium sp. J223]UUX95601.1 AAA family ATPase [Aquabacterium sp. J223]